jgi:hypothetical protein
VKFQRFLRDTKAPEERNIGRNEVTQDALKAPEERNNFFDIFRDQLKGSIP